MELTDDIIWSIKLLDDLKSDFSNAIILRTGQNNN